MFGSLDLQDFEHTFSAYQKPSEEGEEQNNQNSFSKPKTTVLTVIDGRRAQNCTILLSKLKLTNSELARAVMNVDEGEDLPKDMVEQVSVSFLLFWKAFYLILNEYFFGSDGCK